MKRFLSALIIFCLVLTNFHISNFVEASNLSNEEETEKISNHTEESVKVDGDKVELLDERNEYSKTYINSNGTFSTEITQTPQHYQDNKGKWKDIQNDLVRTSKGKFKNKANSFDVEFDETIDKKSVGITVNEDEYKVNLQLTQLENEVVETVQSTIGEVSENQITFPEIFSGISAEYTVGENFVKEDIIIEEKPQNGLPEKFIYKLDLKGLTYKELDNKVYLYDSSTSDPIYMIEAPFMYDAYVPEGFHSSSEIKAIPEESKSYDIKLETKESDGQLYIELVPSQEWLNDENRFYPIVIDPTIYRIQGAELTTDTIIRSGFTSQVGGNDTEIGVGRSGDNIVRSLLRFDLSALSCYESILSVDLSLYLSSTNSTSPINISAHKVSKTWNENEATWKNRTSSTLWTTAGADYNTTAYNTVTGIATIPTNIENGIVKWALPTESLYGWACDPTINYGILLKSTNESTKVYKKFYSSESTVNAQYKPKLVITYKSSSRLGLEDYWDYDSYPLVDGAGYINIGTQNNVLQYTDFTLSNYGGFGFDFVRTYNSKTFEKSALGHSTTFTGNQKLYINTSNNRIDYQDEDGTVHVFNQNGSTFEKPKGFKGTLTKTSDTQYVITEDNIKTIFDVKENAKDTSVKVAYITQQKDLNNNTISYQYNTDNQLVKIMTGLGDSISFAYRNGVIVSASSKGKEITYNYNGKHYITSAVVKKDSTQQTTTSFKYTNNQVTSIIDANGNTTSFNYGSTAVNLGISSFTLPSTTTNSASTTRYNLNNQSLTSTVTSPEGEKTIYYMDSNYVVNKVQNSNGTTTTYTLDDQYQVLKEVVNVPGEVAYTKNYTYSNNNLIKITDSKGITNSYTYNSFGSVLTETDSDGKITSKTYDSKNRLTSTTTPNGDKTSYEYNTLGDLIKVTYPTGVIETYSANYTDNTKKTVNVDTEGNTTETIKDLSGNVISNKDGKNQTTTYQYNLKNELTSVKDPNGNVTSYTYDNNGNLITINNAINKGKTFTYNGQNSITTEKNALGKVTSYAYNADGDLLKVTKGNGDIILYNTDSLTKTTVVSINNVKQYSIVTNGLTTTTTNHLANQSVTNTSSEDGVLKDVTFNGNSTNKVQYGYTNENLTSLKYGSNTINYLYHPNTKQSSISLNSNVLASFNYDKNGMTTETKFGNNKTSIVNAYKGTSTQLQTEKFYTTSTTTPWLKNTYGYDANGQIITLANSMGTTSYTYDAINQLTKETLPTGQVNSYTYDAVGNRTSKAVTKNGVTTTTNYTFNEANQMTKAGSQAYTVDANGNLTNDGRYQYTWNAFNQLTEVKTVSGVAIATYKYDENSRRIYSKVGSTETYYRYDGESNKLLFEENVKGAITKAYTYDSNGHLLTMSYGGETYYYVTNYRGDVLALTNTSGTVVAQYTYDAWGNILTQTGTMATINPNRYAGYRYDEETKLYYLIARYYNPDTGVFLSLDPVSGETKNPVTLNGYNYANNNPVMMMDSDGELAQFVYLAHYAYVGYKTYKTLKKVKVLIHSGLRFASSPYGHMQNPARYVPVSLLKSTIRGKAYKDPKGSSAKFYYSRIYINNKPYNLEVLYDTKTKTIYHFEYARKAMGHLGKIKK